MITEIHIAIESFSFTEQYSEAEVKSKIESMAIDCTTFKENGDYIYCNKDLICDVNIFQNRTIADEIYGDKSKRVLNRDQQASFRKIIEYNKFTNYSTTDIVGLIPFNNAETIRGILYFHTSDAIKDICAVYSKNTWLIFHRHYLGLFPISETNFIEQCQKYFDKLHFRPEVVDTLSGLEPNFNSVTKEVVECLTALNDEFQKYHKPNNRPKSLKDFSAATGFEITPEGRAERKKDFTFSFRYFNGDTVLHEEVCCEPHMKLSASDNPGDSHYYFNRIYFHEGKEHIYGGKILVGHIGKHL